MTHECNIEDLHINIETSYEQNQDCHYDFNSGNEAISEITNSINSQHSYQNKTDNIMQEIPTLEIAYLSNVHSECDPDMSIVLNPHTLTWDEFLTLFYRTGNAFNVVGTNQVGSAISFLNQTYENSTSKSVKFNLAQQVRVAWAAKCKTAIYNISPKDNILLNKETFGIRSLINSSYSVSVTLEQAITSLLDNGVIELGDSTTAASVRFIVQYKYVFTPLNICILINFAFITDIPYYKNTNICDDSSPHETNDTI